MECSIKLPIVISESHRRFLAYLRAGRHSPIRYTGAILSRVSKYAPAPFATARCRKGEAAIIDAEGHALGSQRPVLVWKYYM
jgi:hypothetical protein